MYIKGISKRMIEIVAMILIISTMPNISYAQKKLTIRIVEIPGYTPQNDTLYMASSLDDWTLANKEMQFKKQPDGTYILELNLKNNRSFEYKINRGSWNAVEGNEIGDYLPNRNFIFSANKFDIEIVIKSWQDLHKTALLPVNLHITSIPSNTPTNAKLYVAGSFNNWNFADPTFELTRQDDGTYKGVIPGGHKTFEYKICRGDWESVEGRWDGGVRSNRVYVAPLNNEPETIEIQIASWEDLSSGRFWKMLLFLFLTTQSIQILALLLYFQYSKILSALLSLVTLSFIIVSAYNNPDLFNFFPHGYLLPAVFYAFIAPWLYFWLISFNQEKERKKSSYIFAFAAPFLTFIVLAFPISISYSDFRDLSMVNGLNNYFLIIYGYGLLLNLFYGYKAAFHIRKNTENTPNWFAKLFKAALVNWNFSLLIGIGMFLAYLLKAEVKLLTEWTEKLFWLNIGLTIIYVEWIMIVKVANFIAQTKLKNSKDFSEPENWDVYKKKLAALMESKSLYINPKLTLSDLANYLGTNTYYASRILNEGFGKNFADYINSHRIEAFIKKVSDNPDNDQTFLALAYEVGFNSKSAFNRAFKKVTGATPSEYFNLQ